MKSIDQLAKEYFTDIAYWLRMYERLTKERGGEIDINKFVFDNTMTFDNQFIMEVYYDDDFVCRGTLNYSSLFQEKEVRAIEACVEPSHDLGSEYCEGGEE